MVAIFWGREACVAYWRATPFKAFLLLGIFDLLKRDYRFMACFLE